MPGERRHLGRARRSLGAVRRGEQLDRCAACDGARGSGRRAIARRGPADSSPLLLVDLAVSRDVDPAVAGMAGGEVYTLDDLRQVVEQTLVRRSVDLPVAYSVVCAEVARFTCWMNRRETAMRLGGLASRSRRNGPASWRVRSHASRRALRATATSLAR